MANNKYAYLGQSVRYPLVIKGGSPIIATGKTSIEGALTMILSTPLGSREMLPDYGSRISQFYFEPNDQILATLVRNDIHDCVGKYERRISLLDVQIITHESEVLCNLVYKVLASNEVDSYVYPFSRKGLPY